MYWPRLALTNAQQAPPGCAAQASRVPLHMALTRVHSITGTSTHSPMATPTRVRMVLPTPLKRLARIHGHTPCTRIGGGSALRTSWRTKETSPCACISVIAWPLSLGQRDARIEPGHGDRADARQAEVEGHPDGNGLDRLAGGVEHIVAHGHEIGKADGHGQRRVLGDVE